jgi:hypothetical protein
VFPRLEISFSERNNTFRRLFSLGNFIIDLFPGCLVDFLLLDILGWKYFELALLDDPPFEEFALEALNGIIAASHVLDFLTCSVGGTGIRHGMTTCCQRFMR